MNKAKDRAKGRESKPMVAITQGERWECKRLIQEGLDLIGGIETVVGKGDVVFLKPNLGYPQPPDMPPWTCTTDVMVLTALVELCFEAGAGRVITGDSAAHGVSARYMAESTGVKEAIEKVGGEVVYLTEEPHVTREVPGGLILKKQAVPKVVMDADVLINVPKMKPTRIGKFTLGLKNLFGCVPDEERPPWHRIPEFFYRLTDLAKLLRPALTVMDGLVIQEGYGPRFGNPVGLGVVIMGRDPVATETVAVSVMGHETYEQEVLLIASKYGVGTSDLAEIEVKGKSIESVRRYCKAAPGAVWFHPSPNVVEYIGGACWGCGLWIQYTPFPWEIDRNRKYALVVGIDPRVPEKFSEDKVIILGNCAIRSKNKIKQACPEGVELELVAGCPPFAHRRPGYLKLHGIAHLAEEVKTKYI